MSILKQIWFYLQTNAFIWIWIAILLNGCRSNVTKKNYTAFSWKNLEATSMESLAKVTRHRCQLFINIYQALMFGQFKIIFLKPERVIAQSFMMARSGSLAGKRNEHGCHDWIQLLVHRIPFFFRDNPPWPKEVTIYNPTSNEFRPPGTTASLVLSRFNPVCGVIKDPQTNNDWILVIGGQDETSNSPLSSIEYFDVQENLEWKLLTTKVPLFESNDTVPLGGSASGGFIQFGPSRYVLVSGSTTNEGVSEHNLATWNRDIGHFHHITTTKMLAGRVRILEWNFLGTTNSHTGCPINSPFIIFEK